MRPTHSPDQQVSLQIRASAMSWKSRSDGPAPCGGPEGTSGLLLGKPGGHRGPGLISPPLEAPETHNGLECSGNGCVRGPKTPRGRTAVGEVGGPGLELSLNHPSLGLAGHPARWTACSCGHILTQPLTELSAVPPYAGHFQGGCDGRVTAWPESRPLLTSNSDRPAQPWLRPPGLRLKWTARYCGRCSRGKAVGGFLAQSFPCKTAQKVQCWAWTHLQERSRGVGLATGHLELSQVPGRGHLYKDCLLARGPSLLQPVSPRGPALCLQGITP